MKTASILAGAACALALLGNAGCAVEPQQPGLVSSVDDVALMTRVKSRFAKDQRVCAMAISVATLKGTVQLSGFAKSLDEKQQAGRLALASGAVAVQNDIVVRS